MILITGGTGFIGSKLVRRLIAEGYEVICTCRKESNYSRVKDLYDRITWIDNSSDSILQTFMNYHIEVVIHCATNFGRNTADFLNIYNTNVVFPLSILSAAKQYGIKLFINTDSFYTKELDNKMIKNRTVYMNNYVKSKFIFTESIRDNIDSLDFPFINLRLEHVYGDNDSAGKFVPFLIDSLKNNIPKIELTEGLQGRDWVFIDDVIEAYVVLVSNASLFSKGAFYDYEVGTGVETTLKEFCLKAKEACNSSSNLLFGKKRMDPNELLHSVADNRELVMLGWKPAIDLNEGIRRLL